MALGVASFALTTLVSMMPIGLNILRDSIQSTVQTDILRKLTTQFQETPFDKLANSSAMLFYSDQGTPVTNDADALLGVTYTITASTPLLAAQGGYDNANLKTAVVSFYSRADRAKSPQQASVTSVLYLAPGVN
jgi:uncharacterized protein (TIGR02598 family)